MTTTQELRISDAEIITAFRLATPQHVLALKKAADSYQIVVIETKSGTVTHLESYQDLKLALISFFIGISVELHLDPQRLMKYIADINAQITGKDQTPTSHKKPGTSSIADLDAKMPGKMSVNKTQKHELTTNVPVLAHLSPSDFYTAGKAPEWLQATKNFLDLNAGLTIVEGEHYKLLAMNLKEKLCSQESIIHLQDRHG